MSLEARVLARMATGVENRDPHVLATLEKMPPGHARIVGITGPPGAGKSTLVSALAAALRRRGKTLAIVAVDPSSRASGGAILGDRIRMQDHYADPGIFIRSMATRGSVGGLARSTADMVRLMDAAGRDYVLIETVGVGQDEVEIASLAEVTVVVLVPGMGDDVQAIKAGIMEIADVFAINKADRAGAGQAEQELRAMLELSNGRQPAIVQTVATTGQGIEALIAAIDRHVPQTTPAASFYQSLGSIERQPDLHHILLRVADLRAAAAQLAAAGARPLGPDLFLHQGVLLELIKKQETEDRRQEPE